MGDAHLLQESMCSVTGHTILRLLSPSFLHGARQLLPPTRDLWNEPCNSQALKFSHPRLNGSPGVTEHCAEASRGRSLSTCLQGDRDKPGRRGQDPGI